MRRDVQGDLGVGREQLPDGVALSPRAQVAPPVRAEPGHDDRDVPAIGHGPNLAADPAAVYR